MSITRNVVYTYKGDVNLLYGMCPEDSDITSLQQPTVDMFVQDFKKRIQKQIEQSKAEEAENNCTITLNFTLFLPDDQFEEIKPLIEKDKEITVEIEIKCQPQQAVSIDDSASSIP